MISSAREDYIVLELVIIVNSKIRNVLMITSSTFATGVVLFGVFSHALI